MDSKALGKQGEQWATDYLIKQGYTICARNFRTPVGEIDIIAEKQATYVFVEVKTRHGVKYGTPAQAVNYYKQQKIIKTAYWFLRQQRLAMDCCCRFDVIEIYVAADDSSFLVNHLVGAFEVG